MPQRPYEPIHSMGLVGSPEFEPLSAPATRDKGFRALSCVAHLPGPAVDEPGEPLVIISPEEYLISGYHL